MCQLIDSLPLRRKLAACSLSVAAIEIQIDPMDESPEAQIDDEESLAWIAMQRADGNPWAWCIVQVTVVWRGQRATEYLGGCSYESEASFRASDYFADLVDTCCTTLIADLFETREALCALHGRMRT